MLTVTNSVTPQKLNQNNKSQLEPVFSPKLASGLVQNQVMQTHQQATRQTNPMYVNQGTELKKALIGG